MSSLWSGFPINKAAMNPHKMHSDPINKTYPSTAWPVFSSKFQYIPVHKNSKSQYILVHNISKDTKINIYIFPKQAYEITTMFTKLAKISF